jgi:phage shock protein PspC (stress-responsive transcriptional regulator)
MKKNISINISGIIFHIEEDGYEILRKYLDSINKYFSTFEDSSEILADIESRIAEIFLARLNEGKQVVTSEDVNDLIGTMGNVSDFKAAEEQDFAGTETKQESKKTSGSGASGSTSIPKQLQRDSRRKILGGVCAGLAHYFNIDPVWPRLLFALLVLGSYGGLIILYIILWIILPVSNDMEDEPSLKKMFRDPEKKVVGGVASGVAAFFGADVSLIRVIFVILAIVGVGLLLYIILWIALPEAKSITEKIQMQGDPITLSNIESSIKKGLDEKEGQEESTMAKIILFPFRIIAMIITGIAKLLGPVFRFIIDGLRVLTGVFISIIGIVMIMSFVFAFGVVLGVFHEPSWNVFTNMPVEVSGFPVEAFRNTFTTFTIIAAFLVAFIPSLFITLLGSSIVAKKIVFNNYVGWSLFVLFFLSVVFMGVNIPRLIYAFKEEGEYKTERVFTMTGKTPVFRINENGMDEYNATDLNLKGYDGKELKLIERFEAQGSSRKVAAENAQMIEYTIAQADSIITFDSNIKFKKDAKFRAQRLNMDLFIPYNQPFVVDKALWELINNVEGRYYRFDSEDADETWKITENGLQCITCKNNYVSIQNENNSFHDEFGLSNFNSIELRGFFDVRIQQGDRYAIEMKGSENAKKHYNLSVEGETLFVEYDDDGNELFWKKKFSKDLRVRLTITLPSLVELDAKGAGELKLRGFNQEELDIQLLGAILADGELDAKNLNVNITGASMLELKGNGNMLDADITGASGLKAFGFETKTAHIQAHGASSARVYVTDVLEISKGIASTVSHRGDPQVIQKND